MSRLSAPPDAAQRFLEAVEALNGAIGEGKLAVAVSGGPDSLALLLLAHAAFPGRVLALTVDHGLRPESAAEADMVARFCRDLGVGHRTLVLDGLDGAAGNIQARAREARYAAMTAACREAGAGVLMTAHHADDQAETVLMRLGRGSGAAGLAGIRATRRKSGVLLLRPLLGWRKSELEGIVRAAGLEAADDPSNRSLAYDRTSARALLAQANWLDPVRIAVSARNLADVEAALAWTAEEAWRGRAEMAGTALLLDPGGLPRELVRRLVLKAIAALRPGERPDGPSVDRLIARLLVGKASTLAGVRVRPGRKWRFDVSPPRRGENRRSTHCP